MKVVLLTDKLDKSEVEYQGSYDDVVEVPLLFDVPSGRSICFGAVCTEVHRGSLSFVAVYGLRRTCFPFAVTEALLTFTSQNFRFTGDLVAGLGHAAFLFQCSPARLSNGGFLRYFSFSQLLCCHRASTERGTKELLSQQCASYPAGAGRCASGKHDKKRYEGDCVQNRSTTPHAQIRAHTHKCT